MNTSEGVGELKSADSAVQLFVSCLETCVGKWFD